MENKEKEIQEVQELEVGQNTLIRVMRRVGDPTLNPNENMPSMYNVLNNIFASPNMSYESETEKGFRQRQWAMDKLMQNRIVALMYNIASQTGNLIINMMNEDPVMSELVKNWNGEYEISTMVQAIYQDIYYSINRGRHLSVDDVLSDHSVLYNLATTMDYGVTIATSINNKLYQRYIGATSLPEESHIRIVNTMGIVLDYIVYVMCLIKYETICVYNNAGFAQDKPLVFNNNARELLEYMYDYDSKSRANILYDTTVKINQEDAANLEKVQAAIEAIKSAGEEVEDK